MWILILTIVFNAPYVETRDGFTSREACMEAAALWLKDTERMMTGYITRTSAVCVRERQ